MRDAISGTTLFMIVIFFVILFTGYLCMSINHNKAFAVKNAIVRIVERNGVGLKADNWSSFTGNVFKNDIQKELSDLSYHTKGKCPDSTWKGYDVNGNESSTPVFCIAYFQASTNTGGNSTGSVNPINSLHYFKVMTFYQFDIPIINYLFNLTVEGTTKSMM